MTLLEVIKQEFAEDIEQGKLKFGYNDLKKIYDKLQNCDEFFECHLILNEMPYVLRTIDNVVTNKMVNTHVLYEGNEYTGSAYLNDISLTHIRYDPADINVPVYDGCTISLTPIMYDPADINVPVYDGCTISPYNPENFKPLRKILLHHDVEQTKLIDGRFQERLSENEMREKLHKKLDDLLDNTKKYETKGMRGIMLRGLFNYKTPNKAKRVDYK